MGRKKPKSPDETMGEIIVNLNRSFQNWDYIRAHGCQDPGWEDGVNLNLIRNHIIYDYRQLAEYLDNVQLDLFQPAGFAPELHNLRAVPPALPNDWMCPAGDYPDRLNWKNAQPGT